MNQKKRIFVIAMNSTNLIRYSVECEYIVIYLTLSYSRNTTKRVMHGEHLEIVIIIYVSPLFSHLTSV